MSYDIELLPREGVDEILREREHQDADSVVLNPGPMDANREAWKRRLCDVLLKDEPQFAQFVFDWSEIARIDSIPEEEAMVRYRHIELNLPEDDRSGIQITIYDQSVSITVPYWHQRPAATEVFGRVARFVERLEGEGDLATYDPQIGRIVQLSVEIDEILNQYLRVVARIPQIIQASTPNSKPWWRFW
jgi:hypothetical protein